MLDLIPGSAEKFDEIGPWSEDKLRLFGDYLAAYTTIMNRQSRWLRHGYHYIDGFSGTGQPRVRDAARYVEGSPRIALGIERPFDSYTFIERSSWRAERLRTLRGEFPDRLISIHGADCNAVISNHIVPVFHRLRQTIRGLVFLDPFGLAMEWETIQQIAKTESLEVFINFPTMAINRAGLPNGQNALGDDQVERMNRFWGSEGWRGELYEVRPTLFGDVEMKKCPTTAKRLGDLYRGRLGEVFAYVSEPLVMKNSTGQPLYCLLGAGHNATGVKIINDIFQRYERLCGPDHHTRRAA